MKVLFGERLQFMANRFEQTNENGVGNVLVGVIRMMPFRACLSQHQRALFIVLCWCALSLPAAHAEWYLRSNDKSYRCNSLNAFTDHIANKINFDELKGDDAAIAEAAAFAFSGDGNITRFIGRGFDNLTRRQLKQIRGDLKRCNFSHPVMAQALLVPFDPANAKKTELGKIWLRAIYFQYDNYHRSTVGLTVKNTGTGVAGRCTSNQVVKWLGPQFLDIALLDSANDHLGKVLRGVYVSKNSSLSYRVDRYIEHLNFLLSRIAKTPKAFQAPETYRAIVEKERSDLRELLDPAGSGSYIAEFAKSHSEFLDAATRKIAAAPANFKTWKLAARFESILVDDYRFRCVTKSPAIEKIPLQSADKQVLDAAYNRLSAAVGAKLQKILEIDKEAFLEEIQKLDDDEEFYEFFQSVAPPSSLAQSLARASPIWKVYLDRQERYAVYKKSVAELIEQTDKRIKNRAELALFSHDSWFRGPNRVSGDKFAINLLREVMRPPEVKGDVSDLLARTYPDAEVIVMYRSFGQSGAGGQLQLSCNPDGFVERVKVRAVLDWTVATVNNKALKARRYSKIDSRGKLLDVYIDQVDNVFYTNSVILFAPSAREGFYDWVLPAPDGNLVMRAPRIEHASLIEVMMDACYPAMKRKATLDIPPFS